MKYLGFSFDGKAVSIKEESLDRYLRKSKRGIASARRGAEINLTKMYENNLQFEEKHTKIFRRRMDDSTIKKQIKKHFERIQNLLKIEDKKLKEFLKNEEYKKSKQK